MNEDRRKMLRQAFIDADKDGNGKMDLQEFQELMHKIDPGYRFAGDEKKLVR